MTNQKQRQARLMTKNIENSHIDCCFEIITTAAAELVILLCTKTERLFGVEEG